jgi:hypothetical protein
LARKPLKPTNLPLPYLKNSFQKVGAGLIPARQAVGIAHPKFSYKPQNIEQGISNIEVIPS